jgi:hypothetical protein
MKNLNRSYEEFGSTSTRTLGKVPEHLKDVSEELKNTKQQFDSLRNTAFTVDELNKSLQQTRVSAKNMTSVSEAGKQATKEVRKLTEATNMAKMATMGLSADGTIKISTAEAVAAINGYQDVVKSTTATMIKFKEAGNLGAYEGGMLALKDSIDQVSFSMDDASRSGSSYFKTLQQRHSNNADRCRIAMEDIDFINSINMIQNKTTQGKKIQSV